MKLGEALEHLHGSVANLADELRRLADRHVAQHDVHNLGHLLAERTDGLEASVATFSEVYGARVSTSAPPEAWTSLVGRSRRAQGRLTSRSTRSGTLLLHDLHDAYLQARECEIDWVIVRQGAMAARDAELLDTATHGMAETGRVVKWLSTRIKESAPQVLAGGD